MEPCDEYDDEAELSPVEENPYEGIKLEGASTAAGVTARTRLTYGAA